jgi:hypothetical protein
MEQEEEIRERVLREFNSSTLDDVGPLTTLSGISPESGAEDLSRLGYGNKLQHLSKGFRRQATTR